MTILDHARGDLAAPDSPISESGLEPLIATTPAAVTSDPPRRRERARDWSADHPIDIRCTLPLPFGRGYLTIVAGKERRSAERLAEERVRHPLETRANSIFLFVAGTVFGLASLALVQAVMAFI